MTKCNGKCYLSKQLKKAEEKEQKNLPISNQEKPATILYIQDDNSFPSDYIPKNLNKTLFLEASYLYVSSYIDEIFHPPKLILI